MTFNWKHILLVACNAAVGIYLILAVTAFNSPDEAMAKACTEVNIDIEQESMEGFLNPAEVKKLLTQHQLYPLSQPMNTMAMSPRPMSSQPGQAHFVRSFSPARTSLGMSPPRPSTANAAASESVAPIRTCTGSTRLEATRAMTSRNKYAQKALSKVANQIVGDSFWRNQAVQLNILPNGTIEMVPRVGEHVVYLGSPTNIDSKLERLRKFYIYGLNKAGWNKYNYINVEFSNQIICKKVNSD